MKNDNNDDDDNNNHQSQNHDGRDMMTSQKPNLDPDSQI